MQYMNGSLFDAAYAPVYSPRMSIATRLDKAMAEASEYGAKGISQSELSRKSGVPQATISRTLKGRTDPETDTIRRLAAALGVTFEWLNEGVGPKHRNQGAYTGPERRANPDNSDYNASPEMELRPGKFVAIVGTGQGGPDGYINIDDYPAGQGDGEIFTYSPDPNAYAIRVRGDSMRPRIKSGEYIVAEPNTEAMPGDDVVVKLKNDKAMVKELLWQRDGEVSLGSINASVPPITIPSEEIVSIHRVAAIVPRGSALIRERK